MKIDVKDLEAGRKRLNIEIPAEMVSAKLDEIYEEFRKYAKVPGFRQGKVPKDIIVSRFKEEARQEALRTLLPEAISEASERNKLALVGDMKVGEIKFEKGMPLIFQAEVETKPNVRLRNYKGLKVEKRRVEVKEEEIDKVLGTFQDVYAELVLPQEERNSQEGDFCLCDVSCSAENKVIWEKKGTWLQIKKGEGIPGFMEQLTGVKKDGDKEFTLTLPADYPDKQYAGKPALYNVKIREIKEKKLPQLDDDFAKRCGKVSTLQELKDVIRKDLLSRKESEVQNELREQVIKELLRLHPLDAPPSIVRRHLEIMTEESKENLKKRGFKEEDLKAHEEDIRKGLEEKAVNAVKINYIFDAIAEKEKIEVTDAETDKELSYLSWRYNKTPETIKEDFEKKPEALNYLKLEIQRTKTVDYLISQAEVKEV